MAQTLERLDPYRVLIPKNYQSGMRIEGMIFADEKLMRAIEHDQTLTQIANVATLPGLVGRSLAMPDAHQGYGFAIGGVAAADIQTGIVSAGGVGFDINCGVRLLASSMKVPDLLGPEKGRRFESLLNQLFRDIPCGTGRKGIIELTRKDLDSVLAEGAQWAVRNGYGSENDLLCIEENGRMSHATPDAVSARAKERGREQLGTLGSGNHFVEIQRISEIFDSEAANVFGLTMDQIVVLIHTGSRGLGHQVCTDYLDTMQGGMKKYGIHIVDRQLACVPIVSSEGSAYLSAMSSAANFAFANRQMITHWVREAFDRVLGTADLRLVYDVAHNIAKRECHLVDDKMKEVLVHRKGATRAFPKARPEIPPVYQNVGQPVLIPGSMGTSSYVLVGTDQAMKETFGSSCHGAGRAKSRTAAKKETTAENLIERLRSRGVMVRGASKSGLTEESPEAYKDVSQVVDVVHGAGIARKVAQMIPIGVIKG